jgi:hypothetical protein
MVQLTGEIQISQVQALAAKKRLVRQLVGGLRLDLKPKSQNVEMVLLLTSRHPKP